MYVLDSDVLTFVNGSRKSRNLSAWYDSLDETEIYLSVIVIYEQAKNAARLAKGGNCEAAERVERTLAKLKASFADRVLSLDAAAAEDWGRMIGEREKHAMDTALAAIAKRNNFAVATRNVDHYAGRGVDLINPFKKPPERTRAA